MVTTAIPVPQGAVLADDSPAPVPSPTPSTAGGTVPIPQGAVLADAPTPPTRYGSGPDEQSDFLTKTEDAIDSVSSGSAEEAWNTIKGILSNVAPGMQAATQIPAEIKAFEGARRKGLSVMDAAKESSRVLQQKNNALGAIKDRAKEFVTNPTHASGKLLVDLIPLALGFEGAAGEGAEEATTAADEDAESVVTPETPGIVKQVLQGKNVEQEPAQGALREAAEAQEPSGLESLAQAPQDSLREVLARPVAQAKDLSTTAYEKVAQANKAAEPIVARINELNDKLDEFIAQDEPTRAAEDEAGQMEAERDSLSKELEKHVDPQIAKTASDSYKRYRALQNIEKKVMKNPSIIGGDVKYGTPETVNVDNTINTLRRLQNTKYGDQLEAAFGEEGSQQLLNKLYGAQRMGVHAMRLQNVASWIAKAVGIGAAVGGVKVAKEAASGQ